MILTTIYLIQVFIFMCVMWGLINNKSEIYDYILDKNTRSIDLMKYVKNQVLLCTV